MDCPWGSAKNANATSSNRWDVVLHELLFGANRSQVGIEISNRLPRLGIAGHKPHVEARMAGQQPHQLRAHIPRRTNDPNRNLLSHGDNYAQL